MFTWKLLWQVLLMTLFTAMITAPAYWSDHLSRRLTGNLFGKDRAGKKKPEKPS